MPKILEGTEKKNRRPKMRKKKEDVLTQQQPQDIMTIITDSREQNKFLFPREINSIVSTLKTGDYSILSMENLICVERKSHADFYQSLGSSRERFEREILRMAEFERACFITTVSLEEFLKPPVYNKGFTLFESKLNPRSAINSIISYQVKYNIPTIFAGSQQLGMVYTLRFLEKFWKYKKEKEGEILL